MLGRSVFFYAAFFLRQKKLAEISIELSAVGFFMILSVNSDRKYRKEHRKRALFRRAPFETPHGQRSATFGIPQAHVNFLFFWCITNLLLSKKQSLNLISSESFAVGPHQTSPFAGEASGSKFCKHKNLITLFARRFIAAKRGLIRKAPPLESLGAAKGVAL